MANARTKIASTRTIVPTQRRSRNRGRARTVSAEKIEKDAPYRWYSKSAVKRNLAELCTYVYQHKTAFALLGEKKLPFLEIRYDRRKAKGVNEFEINLSFTKMEWNAVTNAALLGVNFRIQITTNKFVLLTTHPHLVFNNYEKEEEQAKKRQKEELKIARRDDVIGTFAELAERFASLSDKLDSKADLIQRRFMEAWRRANVPSATAT